VDASAHGANALARPSVGMVLLSMRTCGVPTRLRICWPSMALRPWHTLEASSAPLRDKPSRLLLSSCIWAGSPWMPTSMSGPMGRSMQMRSSCMPVSIARAGSRRRLSKTVLTRRVSSGKVMPAARTTGKLALLTRPAVPSGEYQREANGDPSTTSGQTGMPRNCTTAFVSSAAGILVRHISLAH